jgi:uncharacterized membrane protein
MNNVLLSYGISALALAVLDGVWLMLFMKSFYLKQLGHLFGTSFVALPAILFYVTYPLGIAVLVVEPNLNSTWLQVLLRGALLGFVAYGAYDFTNHATLRDWPALVTVVDLAWGTYATAVASVVTFFVVRYWV